MKHPVTVLAFILFYSTPQAQHQDWLPEGAILYYANYEWGLPGPPTIQEIHVIDANETDSSQIRQLSGFCNGCEALTLANALLERIDDKVYYRISGQHSKYLLYDFGLCIVNC